MHPNVSRYVGDMCVRQKNTAQLDDTHESRVPLCHFRPNLEQHHSVISASRSMKARGNGTGERQAARAQSAV